MIFSVRAKPYLVIMSFIIIFITPFFLARQPSLGEINFCASFSDVSYFQKNLERNVRPWVFKRTADCSNFPQKFHSINDDSGLSSNQRISSFRWTTFRRRWTSTRRRSLGGRSASWRPTSPWPGSTRSSRPPVPRGQVRVLLLQPIWVAF